MPKKKSKNDLPIHPPATELEDEAPPEVEAHGDPTPAPARAKKKARSSPPASVGVFGTMPQGTTHFRLRVRLPDGSEEELQAPSGNGGTLVSRWPIQLLSQEFVSAFGPGTYRVRFLGPTLKGACTHKGWGEYVTVPGAPAAEPSPHASSPAPMVPSSPLAEAIGLFGFIAQQSAQQTQQTIAMATAMMSAARPPAATGPDPRDQMIASLQRELREMRTMLVASAAGGSEDDDEDDDDEDDDEEDGDLFQPGVDAVETAKAAGLNFLVDLLKNPATAEAAAELLKKVAPKKPIEVIASRPNGAPTPPAPVVSSTGGGAGDRPNG